MDDRDPDFAPAPGWTPETRAILRELVATHLPGLREDLAEAVARLVESGEPPPTPDPALLAASEAMGRSVSRAWDDLILAAAMEPEGRA